MEKLGSSIKTSDKGLVVWTICWGYQSSIVSLTRNAKYLPEAAGKGHGLWRCSIASTRVPAEVGEKVAALVADIISIRAVCLS